MSMISVCMATFNGERYIEKQLISILPQLGRDDEVIISDDFSTDNTLSVISQLNDYRVKVYSNECRPGPVGNFENALSKSTGTFIFLSDQDDIWEPHKVDIVCSLLLENDLVLSDCQVISQDGTIIKDSFFDYRGSKAGFWANVSKNSYMGCCMAFKREVLTYALPFPENIHMHDWWIGLLVEIKGSVHFYPKPLIKYVRHGNNASPTGESGYGLYRKFKNRYHLLLNLAKRLAK